MLGQDVIDVMYDDVLFDVSWPTAKSFQERGGFGAGPVPLRGEPRVKLQRKSSLKSATRPIKT